MNLVHNSEFSKAIETLYSELGHLQGNTTDSKWEKAIGALITAVRSLETKAIEYYKKLGIIELK